MTEGYQSPLDHLLALMLIEENSEALPILFVRLCCLGGVVQQDKK